MTRSTTELPRRKVWGFSFPQIGCEVSAKNLVCHHPFCHSCPMSAKQNQDKLDKRAAALRENLRKRKELAKTKKENAPEKEREDDE